MHFVAFFGATNLVPRIEHGPVSDQVRFPDENGVMKLVSSVEEARFTVDFFTLKPGRAEPERAAEVVRPVAERVEMVNE